MSKMDLFTKIGISAGVFGGSGVILGAFGAHALKAQLDEASLQIWDTGVKYQLVHAVALLALAAMAEVREGRTGTSPHLLGWVARCWGVGIVCFSGSLYTLALGGPHWLGPVTPLGGLALITGWVLVAVASWKK
jgi:uncharacterized membrane protein YgdD (TMEM256/DUF423 family)